MPTSGQPRGLTHDLASRIVALDTNSYSYDSLDRLIGAAVAQGDYGYGYDASGNRSAMTVSSNTFAYSIDATSNRLLSIGGASSWNYSHDANGSVLSDGTRQYSYDARGRLSGIVTAQGTTQFDIDARNLRVRKSGPQGERYYHYDPAGRLIAESTAGGAYDLEYLYLDELPVAVVADGTLYHIDPDHLGTPRLVTNGQGNPVWRWEGGEPFGAQAPEEDPGQTGSRFVLNLRFPGQYYDAETQLHYNHHRDYDPATGRYVESDPIGLAGGSMSLYGYVEGNPGLLTDPAGKGAVGFAKCIYYSYKISKAIKTCQKECQPMNDEELIKYMESHSSDYLSDALMKCACEKAGGDTCENWLASCVMSPYGVGPKLPKS